MGTRGLLGLIIKGQRHASYNPWDSYPSGLGQEIVKFILSLESEDYATMQSHLEEVTWVDAEGTPSPEIQKEYTSLGYSDLEVSNKTPEEWYCLLRNTQGTKALPQILKGDLKHMIESVEFINDSLFCE